MYIYIYIYVYITCLIYFVHCLNSYFSMQFCLILIRIREPIPSQKLQGKQHSPSGALGLPQVYTTIDGGEGVRAAELDAGSPWR